VGTRALRSRLRLGRPSSPPGTILRESEFWTRDQYVTAAALDGAARVELIPPATVPIVNRLRKQEDRVWRPQDYAGLPSRRCPGPGYTMLEDVRLSFPGTALAPDGRFIEDPLTRLNPPWLSPELERDLSLGAERRRRRRAKGSVEKGILLAGDGVDVYGHQLVDFLPGLAMLDEFDLFADWPLLLPSRAPEWLPPLIEVFSRHSREVRTFSHRRSVSVEVGELCVPWVLRHPGFHPAASRVFDRIAGLAADEGNADGRGHRIFILRQRQARRLTNVDEVTAIFKARGFEPVAPEQLPFLDQVRLFAGAEFVAGEAGSALHGAVFSKPGTTTIELRPETYHIQGQPAIAVLRGLVFTSVKGAQPGGRMSREPWTLDLDAVERRLEEVGV
jgi:glycosyl transferase family 61